MTKNLSTVLLTAALMVAGSLFAEEKPHWKYSGAEGPANWAALSSEFSACAGKNQSPINLTAFIEAELEPLKFSYKAGGENVVNNGHSIQVNYSTGSSITADGTDFELKQFHFHSPSENQINGKSYPMEMHLVHADKNGNLAVVAVMFSAGEENKSLAAIWSAIPGEEGKKAPLSAPADVSAILPADRDYYRFNGSLTTPPCTEGVRWLVLKNGVTVSQAQVETFTKVMKTPNNRPVQPVNARPVLK